MAYASSLRHSVTFFGLHDWFASKLRNARAQREQYQKYFQTLNTLSRASDRQLADIGIRREEIADIARKRAGL